MIEQVAKELINQTNRATQRYQKDKQWLTWSEIPSAPCRPCGPEPKPDAEKEKEKEKLGGGSGKGSKGATGKGSGTGGGAGGGVKPSVSAAATALLKKLGHVEFPDDSAPRFTDHKAWTEHLLGAVQVGSAFVIVLDCRCSQAEHNLTITSLHIASLVLLHATQFRYTHT